MHQNREILNTIRRRVERIRHRMARTRADESGLTTLEWLLIVAAVAGLAALAVVLVTNVVDETSEQISGSSARVTAAKVAADAIVSDSDRNAADQPANVDTYEQWIAYYAQKCNRLSITYGDAGITVMPNFATGVSMATVIAATDINPAAATETTTVTTAATDKAVAQCLITD